MAQRRRSKLETYRDHFAELEHEDIRYHPMTTSAYGRCHPETDSVLEALARAAARRRGLRDHRSLLRRTRASIGAGVVRSCIGAASADEVMELVGFDQPTVPADFDEKVQRRLRY